VPQVAVKISDIKLNLTQMQYRWLMALLQAIPRILAADSDGNSQAARVADESSLLPSSPPPSEQSRRDGVPALDLQPELRRTSADLASRSWTAVDLVMTLDTIKLHLYDESAAEESSLKAHGIARFAMNGTTLRLKTLNNGALEAQIVLHSFTMSDIRPGNFKYREIIPSAQHDRNQFMVLYTNSGDSGSTSLAIVTIDAPHIIFSIDPVFALLDFFTSGIGPATESSQAHVEDAATADTQQKSGGVDFRVDMHDVSVSILENDSVSDSQAIVLSVQKLLLSQQVMQYLAVVTFIS
jgi:vacuolar protein sorting-associated protein 13A/C